MGQETVALTTILLQDPKKSGSRFGCLGHCPEEKESPWEGLVTGSLAYTEGCEIAQTGLLSWTDPLRAGEW